MSINELIVFAVVATIVHRQRRIDRARPSVPKCPAATARRRRRSASPIPGWLASLITF